MSVPSDAVALDWPGATLVRARAVEHVVRAVTAAAAGAPAGEVTVALADRDGALGVDVVVPLVLVPQERRPLPQRAAAICAQIADRTAELTGRTVGEVHVRFATASRPAERRVR